MTASNNCLLASIAVLCVVGCAEPSDLVPVEATLIDSKTGERFRLASVDQVPAVHPETGERTLMPAMFCPRCEVWQQVPSPEHVNRIQNAMRCANCQGELVLWAPAQVRNNE